MSLPYSIRTECRLCLSRELVKVVEFPLAIPGEHLKTSVDEPDPQAIPIDWYQCARCGHVQIIHIPPLEMLFNKDYTFMPGGNPDLIAHFRRTIDYFLQSFSPRVDFAFELGSNDGVFLDELRSRTNCRVLGMDPALAPANVARQRGVETLVEFFDQARAQTLAETYGRPDVVVANNVFAHNDDLRGMIRGIADLLRPGGYFLFEVSWLKAVVDRFLIGTIIHEHLSVHSLCSLQPCLSAFGLQLAGVRQAPDIQGGAIVGVARKTGCMAIPADVACLINGEKAAGLASTCGLARFKEALGVKVATLQTAVRDRVGAGKIIGYGAARSAPFIIDVLEMGDRIACVVDDNPVKKDKFMPTTNIPVVGSQDSRISGAHPLFLILGWAQTGRIIEKLRCQYPHGAAVTIYPSFEVVPFR